MNLFSAPGRLRRASASGRGRAPPGFDSKEKKACVGGNDALVFADMGNDGEPRAYPQRLHHRTPAWVRQGSTFHIRIRAVPDYSVALTQPEVARSLLRSARHYHETQRWGCALFLLMPDHLHALLSFPYNKSLWRVVGDWKRYTARDAGVSWQANFFDHRIRQSKELSEKYAYILRNPVVKGLCEEGVDWPWQWHG